MSNYRRHPSDGLVWSIGWAFAITIFCVLGWLAGHALSLPTVAKDIDGKVVYVEFSDGVKHYGAKELPKKYQSITVALESTK